MRRAFVTGLYSLIHFLIDFACAFFIFGSLRGADHWLLCLLTYNFFAFAMQLPFGIFADILDQNKPIAAAGCLILAFAPLFSAWNLLPFALAGLGNGLFHIGAGREVLQHSPQQFTALGIFVSPGALGLFFGGLAGKSGAFPVPVVMGVLVACGLLLLFLPAKLLKAKGDESLVVAGGRVPASLPMKLLLLPLSCLFLVIFLRSYVGLTLDFPWKGEGQTAFWLVVALAGGKAVGGLFADRFGALKTSFISLFLSALLLFFFRLSPLGILSVFLFNMTMPLTLGGLARLLPAHPGLAFGLTTFGLFLGFLPVLTGLPNPLIMPYGYAAISIFSAILLYYGFRGKRHAP